VFTVSIDLISNNTNLFLFLSNLSIQDLSAGFKKLSKEPVKGIKGGVFLNFTDILGSRGGFWEPRVIMSSKFLAGSKFRVTLRVFSGGKLVFAYIPSSYLFQRHCRIWAFTLMKLTANRLGYFARAE